MALLKWLTTLTFASSLALGSPAARQETTDIADEWVSELIANLTEVDSSLKRRGLLGCSYNNRNLVVDLGYAKYRAHTMPLRVSTPGKGKRSFTIHENSAQVLTLESIRYAAPPTGNKRWQPPFPPAYQGSTPIDASQFGAVCPQFMPSIPGSQPIPGGDEDCLFLNVYAPPNARNLPVLVYIHEGGYGFGDGTRDLSDFINANEKGVIGVTIQYRLGAFGWLSSAEVKQKGVVNAGMLDQAFALAWIKTHICKFGGDPTKITISGESASGGSVMYHTMAVGGNLGTLLFNQGIAASPYLPFQYKYDDPEPTSKYYAFSAAAGCPSSGNVFNCLVSKDSETLKLASFNVTQSSTYGYWGFWPVTDNVYIQKRPSQQLPSKKVNGKKLLVGHNANEGGLFVPPSITTESDLIFWLQQQFPNLSTAQLNTILAANPNSANTDPSGPHFETNGLTGPTAVEVAQDANGQQQRGNNIYAEQVFVCPAYWMADSFVNPSKGQSSWLYQYSVPYAYHSSDISAYFGPPTTNQPADFILAFRRIWGNFVRTGNPSISAEIANGASSPNPSAPHPATNWPVWSNSNPQLLNLNTTGGTPYQEQLMWGPFVTQFQDALNDISLAPADVWEGGRRSRCDLYLSLGSAIPL